MSELVGLGRSDADVRWLGIGRHQAALVIGGSVLVGDWLVRTGSPVIEVLIGVVMVSAAVRCVRGLTGGEFLKVVVLFCARSRWQRLAATREGDVVELRAGGTAAFRGYELNHRGRLDLSGTDVVNAQRLADLMNGLAVGADSSHVSLHVRRSGPDTRTFLALATDAAVCEGWSPSERLVDEVIGMDVGSSSLVLERWSYLRTNDQLRRVIRVDDFQGATSERALLERLQEVALDTDLALHVEVVGSLRAQRIAARAVHRVGSDAQVSRAAGFRRSAHAALSSQRLSQREELVANGQALLRLGVFVTLRSSSLSELRDSSRELQRKVVESGLRVDTGVGRQWSWFCFQLPGGPGW